jgi:hypothetical protein
MFLLSFHISTGCIPQSAVMVAIYRTIKEFTLQCDEILLPLDLAFLYTFPSTYRFSSCSLFSLF